MWVMSVSGDAFEYVTGALVQGDDATPHVIIFGS
jgi:hypothetical protein